MSFFDLGTWTRKITTAEPEAQLWFDRGLNWLFGFNHEEAIVCFEKALEADAACVMAHWGIAHCIGPNYNKLWEFFTPDERVAALDRAHHSLKQAAAVADRAIPVEHAILIALAARFPTDPAIEDYGPWNDAFAEEMRRVHTAFPDDLDVTAVFAEALMNRTPWKLWDLHARSPAEGASTLEAQGALERAFASDPAVWDHPGLLHMYIHLMEMSPTPERALRHGDRLVDLVPDSGHLVHMATHIDVLCGDYQSVVWRNLRAASVDRKYFDHVGGENFYTIYRIHNLHFVIYGAMFLARPTAALAAAEALRETLPEQVVRYMPEFFEAFIGMKLHVLVRFGRWQAVLDEPFPTDPALYLNTTALLHYARTVALANLGRLTEARVEREAFTVAQRAVPEGWMMFNNPCSAVLLMAEQMMLGELAYKSGRIEDGLEHLRAAVRLDDGMLYDEPWGWMQPTRHALGALLMGAEQYAEAEAVCRADLGLDQTLPRPCQHPRNVWSLHGLDECLDRRGETVERRHVQPLLDQAIARAELPIRASCYCRTRAA